MTFTTIAPILAYIARLCIFTVFASLTCHQVLLLEHNIPTAEFSAAVLACLPPSDWCISPSNSIGRRDLRSLPVLSIDPPGCKDIDDALHAIVLPNGNVQVVLCGCDCVCGR